MTNEMMATLSTCVFAIGGLCAWILGLMLVSRTVANIRWKILSTWPPQTAFAVGLPVMLATTHLMLYDASQYGWLPGWIERGSFLYEMLPLLAGVGLIVLFILAVTGQLITDDMRRQ